MFSPLAPVTHHHRATSDKLLRVSQIALWDPKQTRALDQGTDDPGFELITNLGRAAKSNGKVLRPAKTPSQTLESIQLY